MKPLLPLRREATARTDSRVRAWDVNIASTGELYELRDRNIYAIESSTTTSRVLNNDTTPFLSRTLILDAMNTYVRRHLRLSPRVHTSNLLP